jgi:hypothetical protein
VNFLAAPSWLQDLREERVREETTELFFHWDAGFFAKLLSPLIPLRGVVPLPWINE